MYTCITLYTNDTNIFFYNNKKTYIFKLTVFLRFMVKIQIKKIQ